MRDARERLRGSMPALITPFRDGKVDEAAFRKLVSWQIAEGSHGLVPAGTTGKSPTLSHEEHMRVVATVRRGGQGPGPGDRRARAPIPPPKRSRSHATPRRSARMPCCRSRPITTSRRRKGSTAISRPSPKRWIFPSSSTTSPAAAWSRFPWRRWRGWPRSRTSSGVKDATANLVRPSRERGVCGKDFRYLSGEDAHRAGLHGPWRAWLHLGDGQCGAEALRRIPERLHAGRLEHALALQDRLMPLHDAMFCEAEPGAGEICGLAVGAVHRRSAPAARARKRTGARPHPRGDGVRRRPQSLSDGKKRTTGTSCRRRQPQGAPRLCHRVDAGSRASC